MIKILIGLWLAVTAFKFFAGLRRKDGDSAGAKSSDSIVLEARACAKCGVYGEQPCRNCSAA